MDYYEMLNNQVLDADEHWEFECISLNLCYKGLGISIKGGLDSPAEGTDDPAIYVSKIFIDGMAFADGRLQLGDIILSVNGFPLIDVMHFEAVDAIISAGTEITFYVKRKKCFIYEQIDEVIDEEIEEVDDVPIEVEGRINVELNKGDKGFGICITGGKDNQHIKGDNGIFVTRIVENGVAERDGRINVGDRLIAINDESLEDVTYDEAVNAMRFSPKKSVIIVVKN